LCNFVVLSRNKYHFYTHKYPSIVEKRVFRTSFDQPVDPVVFQGGFTGYSAGSAPPHEHAALALVETLDEFEADIAGG
jgi:hypothetical protein